MSELEILQDGYEEDGYEMHDGYHVDERPKHDWDERIEGKQSSAICKRCGLKKSDIIKNLNTHQIAIAVMGNSQGSDFSKVSEMVGSAIDEDYCWTEDQLAVKDIIE